MRHLPKYRTVLETRSFLSQLYAESHRKYHTMNHIMQCMAANVTFFENERSLGTHSNRNEMLVGAMVWFHDSVYNPYAPFGFNERWSAELYKDYAEQYYSQLPDEDVQEVYDGIIASSLHHRDQPNLTKAQQAFLDIDLAEMACDYSTFTINGQNIREEYAHVPFETFLEKRIEFFKTMLKRKSLYYTDFFKEKCQEKAVANITKYLSTL
jgi:predicted metal-dependent HD superfamily phosphohydrolase